MTTAADQLPLGTARHCVPAAAAAALGWRVVRGGRPPGLSVVAHLPRGVYGAGSNRGTPGRQRQVVRARQVGPDATVVACSDRLKRWRRGRSCKRAVAEVVAEEPPAGSNRSTGQQDRLHAENHCRRLIRPVAIALPSRGDGSASPASGEHGTAWHGATSGLFALTSARTAQESCGLRARAHARRRPVFWGRAGHAAATRWDWTAGARAGAGVREWRPAPR